MAMMHNLVLKSTSFEEAPTDRVDSYPIKMRRAYHSSTSASTWQNSKIKKYIFLCFKNSLSPIDDNMASCQMIRIRHHHVWVRHRHTRPPHLGSHLDKKKLFISQ